MNPFKIRYKLTSCQQSWARDQGFLLHPSWNEWSDKLPQYDDGVNPRTVKELVKFAEEMKESAKCVQLS